MRNRGESTPGPNVMAVSQIVLIPVTKILIYLTISRVAVVSSNPLSSLIESMILNRSLVAHGQDNSEME